MRGVAGIWNCGVGAVGVIAVVVVVGASVWAEGELRRRRPIVIDRRRAQRKASVWIVPGEVAAVVVVIGVMMKGS